MVFKKIRMNQKEMLSFLKESMKDALEDTDYDGNTFKSVNLGSFMNLDPCGRYHHILSPNGITEECERFWESLQKVAEKLNGCIEAGEGDPTDIFFKFDFKDANELENKELNN